MKKVLLLSASYGEGHNAAARGLLAALQRHEGCVAEMYDPYPEALGDFYNDSRRQYLEVIEKYPRLWAFIYHILHITPVIWAVLPFLSKPREVLRRKVEAFQPEIIVSVYPVYSYLLNRLFTPGPSRSFRLYTLVTDSITINSVWYRTPSDTWLLPNEASAEVMRRARVPAGRVRVSGFPVMPIFADERPVRPVPGGKEPLRVLYMITADKTTAPALVQQLLGLDGLALSITVGRDEKLRESIEEAVRRSGRAAKIYGWTPHMPEMLMNHHVLIGKAGGAAVQETIAAATPMLITKAVPGQEEGNARLLVEGGCGALCFKPAAVVAKLRELLADDARLWKEWHTKIALLSRPDAALRLAENLAAE